MMKNFLRNSVLLLAPVCIFGLAACDSRDDVVGTWQGTATRIDDITAAVDGSMSTTIEFAGENGKQSDRSGKITITALLDANQPVSSSDSSLMQAYEVSVAATASITGDWTYEDRDDDDIIVSLDPESLKVRVDPDGVTFSQDILTGKERPVLDSLTAATAAVWTRSLTAAMRIEFGKYQKISDVKVKKNILSCEIDDRDYSFRRVGAQQ